MTYELCEKLKEVGFPQNFRYGYNRDVFYRGIRTPFRAIQEAKYEDGMLIEYMRECVIIPSLSELILACGEKFECLYRIVNQDLSIKYWKCHAFGFSDIPSGVDPEIAVANLFIKINEKEKNVADVV
jgi:hypothetical protein